VSTWKLLKLFSCFCERILYATIGKTLRVLAICQECAENPLNYYQRWPRLQYLCFRLRYQLSKWYSGSGLLKPSFQLNSFSQSKVRFQAHQSQSKTEHYSNLAV